MTLSIPNFHIQRGSVGYFCYQEVHTNDTISTCEVNGCMCTVCLLPRAGFTLCLQKRCFTKVQHRWHFPKVSLLPNQHTCIGVSLYTGETVLVCTSPVQTSPNKVIPRTRTIPPACRMPPPQVTKYLLHMLL